MRRIVVSGEAAASAGAPAARGNVDVLTWARNIPAGEVVQPQDLVWAKAAAAPADAPNDPEALIGQAARHALRQGGVATARDVAQVQVIKAKDVITVTYEAGGVSLALQGVALSSGGVGDAINVQNPSSKKILQAVVTGPGQALVGPAASQLKANPSRIALR
jgi:flagella basal body P-ring formation protein FlgA